MTDERLAVGIRDAFESTHVPSLGLEDRVVSATGSLYLPFLTKSEPGPRTALSA